MQSRRGHIRAVRRTNERLSLEGTRYAVQNCVPFFSSIERKIAEEREGRGEGKRKGVARGHWERNDMDE